MSTTNGFSADPQALEKDDITVVDKDAAKKAIKASSIGNAMEWFDFGIYSYLAATLGKVFFPEMSGSVQLVYTFATFAVAFLVRPIGGIFFGRLGDKMGRKKILAITLIMMAAATFCIGLIPSYETVGVTAAVLLLLARLVQGFSTGGEYSGAMTFIAESTPDNKRGIFSSWLEVGTLIGYVAGAGLVTLLTFILGEEAMTQWGWRIPFFIAGPIGIVGFYLRSHLAETPAFEAMEESENDALHQSSMTETFKDYWKPMLIGIIVVFFYNISNYTVLSYMPSHLSAVLNYGETKGLLLTLIVMAVMIPIVLFMGYLGDKIGRKKVIIGGLIGYVLLSIPAFMMIGSGNSLFVFLGIMILAIFLTSFQGTMPAMLPSLFFTRVRYGALSVTYNVSTSLFGGTAPLLVAWLISLTHNNYIPAFYLIGSSVIGIIVMAFFVKETAGKSLRGSMPAVDMQTEIKEVLKEPEEALWWKEETNGKSL
ncbi:MFS transporter [Metabacillus sp. GX 13764]|uniref:MFS transporter n=1 Tax=Metabacillus kandeliae TaxID=2900151 RepID=UPI001E61CE04|nr:MFS transporter [Metabacillus kandeliae]MCD7035021.1 MFS transporter [Metabacillus kandeliae]